MQDATVTYPPATSARPPGSRFSQRNAAPGDRRAPRQSRRRGGPTRDHTEMDPCMRLVMSGSPTSGRRRNDYSTRDEAFRDLCEEYEACTRAADRLDGLPAGGGAPSPRIRRPSAASRRRAAAPAGREHAPPGEKNERRPIQEEPNREAETGRIELRRGFRGLGGERAGLTGRDRGRGRLDTQRRRHHRRRSAGRGRGLLQQHRPRRLVLVFDQPRLLRQRDFRDRRALQPAEEQDADRRCRRARPGRLERRQLPRLLRLQLG